ncbi:hypothetical protein HMPREF0758_1353, partial [Serratia odorifera DSM 4582]
MITASNKAKTKKYMALCLYFKIAVGVAVAASAPSGVREGAA